MRKWFLIGAFMMMGLEVLAYFFFPGFLWSLVIVGPLVALGFRDYLQTRHAILRNFPIIDHMRYCLESLRPEIQQYFIEMNTEGMPLSREERSIIYQRSKKELATLPFGTQRDVYAPGYEWVNHSICPVEIDPTGLRVTVGGPDCAQPYSASLFNISAMSYGALSKNAILALNGGAKMGGFAHNTGEGAISPYHLEPGGDLIWQIGTGYFGCRTAEGGFCEETFEKRACIPNVKMIEIKLSQGAKPGHGGILPGRKVTKEIAEIRDVPLGQDVISPSGHSAFSTPIELMHFIARLRALSGGKPVGFKLCLGKRREFISLCKAMEKTGITPDFIAVDGGEGGTGAAPFEFSNHIGAPGIESLIFIHNALTGFSIRDRIKVIASGKVTTGFGIIKRIALGADLTYSARGMMLALGCIQALRCNANVCPTGIATQNPYLVAGLVVGEKKARIFMYHEETIRSTAEILGAMGLTGPGDLRPWHIMRRISQTETRHYGELFEFLESGGLLNEHLPASYVRACRAADAETFSHVPEA